MCNGEAQDSKSVDMESLPEEKGIQEKARYEIICKSFFLFFWRVGGEVVLINILHTACPHYFHSLIILAPAGIAFTPLKFGKSWGFNEPLLKLHMKIGGIQKAWEF